MRPRRAAAWLLSLPLMIAGSQVAHVLAYELVYPNAHVRLAALLASGHGYMTPSGGYLPLVLALAGAIDLLAAGWVLAGSVRRSLQRPVPAWAFALLPVLCFTLQEIFERWLAGSPFPWWTVLAPAFQVGLLLQIPFALVAFFVARLLIRTAQRAAHSLRRVAPRPLRIATWSTPVSPRLGIPRRRPGTTIHPGRGPPAAGLAAARP